MHAQKAAHLPDFGSTDHLSSLTDFGSNPGALKARSYLPEDLPKGAPLVVVLHGCTQNAAAYDHGSGWSQLADQAGFAVLYPEQQRTNNPNLCFNWFFPADTTRDSGEALSIRQMIETLVVSHGLDPKRIFVTGLSAGGAMASAMLATYPEVFAGGAIIAGLAHGSATTIPEAFDRMRGHGGPSAGELQQLLRGASDHKGHWPRISIWQGSADQTVVASNADAIAAQWLGVHKLKAPPTRSETTDGYARQVWCNASGEPVIELNAIPGMAHGTPIGDGLGVPGPFMLDVGISSTREIARFWGIAKAAIGTSAKPRAKMQNGTRPASEKAKAKRTAPEISAASPKQAPVPDSLGVRKIIEDALRAAGLMR